MTCFCMMWSVAGASTGDFSTSPHPSAQASMDLVNSSEAKPAPGNGTEDLTLGSRSKWSSNASNASTNDTDSPSPRNQLGSASISDKRIFVEGANTGDGFDPRWVAQTLNEERVAESLSGDGSLENVGINVSGVHQCELCVQQFGCADALHAHIKFMHQEEEQKVEWLPFPSA